MSLQEPPDSVSTDVRIDVSSAHESLLSATGAALNFAASFHRDAQACRSTLERQNLHEIYRDKILAIDGVAANVAAAFLPFLRTARSPERGDHDRWGHFDRLAQRGRKMRDRESQRLQHQSGIIAAWGLGCFEYYGWHALPLPLLRQLHDLAVLMPRWEDVVGLLNSKMLARHELRVMSGKNKALRIGEHSPASKVQASHSPVERSDILAALEWAQTNTASATARPEVKQLAHRINETPIRQFGLKLDVYGMIVPSTDSEAKNGGSGGGDHDGDKCDDDVDGDASEGDHLEPSNRPTKRTRLSSTSRGAFIPTDAAPSERGRDSATRRSCTPSNNLTGSEEPKEPEESRPGPQDQTARNQSRGNEQLQVIADMDSSGREIAREKKIAEEGSITEALNMKDGTEDDEAGFLTRYEHSSDTEDGGQGAGERVGMTATKFNRTSRKGSAIRTVTYSGKSPGARLPTPQSSKPYIKSPPVTGRTAATHSGECHSSPVPGRSGRIARAPAVANVLPLGGSVPAPQTRSSPVSSESGSLPWRRPTLLQNLQAHHADAFGQLVEELGRPHVSEDVLHQRSLQLNWLGPQRWARIHADPEDRLGRSCVASREDADVWYLSWDVFRSYAETGFIFKRPVVIKQKFQDSGTYDIVDYIDMLWQRFPEQQIDVQNSATGVCSSMSLADYCLAVAHVDLSSSDAAAAISSVTNLRRLARADEPLLIRLPRFRLLSTLADRVAGTVRRSGHLITNDVQGCLGFNLLCFAGAFSGAHVDPLGGSWSRCLYGTQIVAVAVDLDDGDWRRFSREGRDWSPRGQGRLIVLEQDDVLLMPPGLRAIRATFAPEPCLVEGGMLWDECAIPEILEGLLWVANNRAYTHDTIHMAFQLFPLIDAMEKWLDDDNYVGRPSTEDTAAERNQAVKAGIRSLRALLRLSTRPAF
ncbi:hypothetical protein CCHL11_04130 [Colletotrichum chlorophyti]|uniref:JmjC domain-containing protein n=1 Tax=Colletotrichum chlorophyti TaxID=708187 RepID=A0A1Q8RPH6_9PEZI|nr:hypothetical protein CCHL11_04130 [Colletotrichum chlorophyti]